MKYTNEPRHDKTNIMGLQPAWIQTSLRIRAVWSGSTLFAISFSTFNRVGKRRAWILIRLRGCAGWSGFMLVANALCLFCRDAAHNISDEYVCLIFVAADESQSSACSRDFSLRRRRRVRSSICRVKNVTVSLSRRFSLLLLIFKRIWSYVTVRQILDK
jgi:hypothetical protein